MPAHDKQPVTEAITRTPRPSPWAPVSLESPAAFESLLDIAQSAALPDFWTAAGAEMAKWVSRVVGKLPAEVQGRVVLVTHKDRPFYYELILGREKLSAFEVTVIAKEVSHAV
jgi:hypothetical protein